MENQSKGFGDTLAKVFDATGISTAVKTITNLVGIEDCGCKKRQEILNNLFPYQVNNQIPTYENMRLVTEQDTGIKRVTFE